MVRLQNVLQLGKALWSSDEYSTVIIDVTGCTTRIRYVYRTCNSWVKHFGHQMNTAL